MFQRPSKEVNAEYPADERYLDNLQRIVREACATAGMSRKDTSAVLLAIEEGATNIIRHAYLYEKGLLRLRIVIYSRQIIFSLIDTGRSFRPEGTGQLDLERLVESGRRGGLGFYMIQKIMDSVEYVSTPAQNELRMAKRLGPRPDHGAAPLLRRMLTLRAKFSLWTFFIVSIIIVTAFYFINKRTVDEIYRHLDGTVLALGKTISEQAGLYMLNRRSDVEFDELVVSFYSSNPIMQHIVITDSGGVILAHSDDIHNIRNQYQYPPYAQSDLLGQPQRSSAEGQETNYLILPIETGGRTLGAVHITYSSAPIYARLDNSRNQILILTAILVLIGIVGIYLLSNYFVKPIVNITRRVRRFSKGDLESELPLEGAEEFFEIQNALNEMITRLRRDRETAVEREKMAKEIEVASQIQKTLLPRYLPELPGLQIDAFYRSASMISGDLYDVFQIGPDRCCMVVADVSGKGVPASLMMSMLRTVIKIYSQHAGSARATLGTVNDFLSENMPKGMFVTVLMAIYDAGTRRLDFVSAGHNPLLLYRSGSQRVGKLNPPGMPLGVPVTLEKSFVDSLEEVSLQLEQGDLFFLYTDGITEAVDRSGEQYGLPRLMDFIQDQLRNGHPSDLQSLSGAIVREIDRFSGFAAQRDDITFIIGRTITPDSEARVEEESAAVAIASRSIEESPSDGTEA